MYYTVVIPPDPTMKLLTPTPWHAPGKTVTRGVFDNEKEAHAWAVRNIPGSPYSVQLIDDGGSVDTIEIGDWVNTPQGLGVVFGMLPFDGYKMIQYRLLTEGDRPVWVDYWSRSSVTSLAKKGDSYSMLVANLVPVDGVSRQVDLFDILQ